MTTHSEFFSKNYAEHSSPLEVYKSACLSEEAKARIWKLEGRIDREQTNKIADLLLLHNEYDSVQKVLAGEGFPLEARQITYHVNAKGRKEFVSLYDTRRVDHEYISNHITRPRTFSSATAAFLIVYGNASPERGYCMCSKNFFALNRKQKEV